MKAWAKVLIAACLVPGGALGTGALGCEVVGETCRFDQPGSPWVSIPPAEYSNCEECKAAIEDAYAKYPRYYRNLRCQDCDCGQNGSRDNSSAGPSNNQSSQEESEFDKERKSGEEDQQAADENEHQANIAKDQKFKDDKQDALSQLKGVAGDSEESANETGNEPISKKLKGPRERARNGSGGGLDRPADGAKPRGVIIPPASPPMREEPLVTLKRQVKQYKRDLEEMKKKIQRLNTQITRLAVKINETAAPEAEPEEVTPQPGAPEAKPARAPNTDDSAAKKLAELNALRQAAMADQTDLEKKISDSEKQVDEMSKPTPAP